MDQYTEMPNSFEIGQINSDPPEKKSNLIQVTRKQ